MHHTLSLIVLVFAAEAAYRQSDLALLADFDDPADPLRDRSGRGNHLVPEHVEWATDVRDGYLSFRRGTAARVCTPPGLLARDDGALTLCMRYRVRATSTSALNAALRAAPEWLLTVHPERVHLAGSIHISAHYLRPLAFVHADNGCSYQPWDVEAATSDTSPFTQVCVAWSRGADTGQAFVRVSVDGRVSAERHQSCLRAMPPLFGPETYFCLGAVDSERHAVDVDVDLFAVWNATLVDDDDLE